MVQMDRISEISEQTLSAEKYIFPAAGRTHRSFKDLCAFSDLTRTVFANFLDVFIIVD